MNQRQGCPVAPPIIPAAVIIVVYPSWRGATHVSVDGFYSRAYGVDSLVCQGRRGKQVGFGQEPMHVAFSNALESSDALPKSGTPIKTTESRYRDALTS